jgi:co-chaperonin GroES (HSP10)
MTQDFENANLPLTPVGYYLLLEERRAIQKTAGGILLAPETQDAQQYLCQIGKVVALGDLCYTHDAYKGQAWAQLGDDVLFYKNSGIRIDLKAGRDEDPTRYRLMKDNDILAVVTDPDRIKGAVV